MSRVAVWLLALWVGAPAVGLAQKDQPVHTYSLTAGVVAKVHPDGALILNTGPDFTPLLSAEVVPLTDSRRRRRTDKPPFTTVVAEGAAGGQRGFSTQRDDDRDGAVDEDLLDGQDNDGDGRIDEDYAAISDAMVVVHQGDGGATHLEYYHWAYPHLRAAVFLAARSRPGLSSGGTYRLVLSDQHWSETTIVSDRHNIAGQAESQRVNAFVAQPARPDRDVGLGRGTACDPGARLWIGVALLDVVPGMRAVLDGGALELPLGEQPLPVVICVAESWLQLNRLLNEAVRVRAGVRDKLTGERASWIVPSLCAHCRLAAAPDFSWQRTESGDLQLTAGIVAGRCRALDPDLFRLAERRLGAPREIRWLPDAGPGVTIPWRCMSAALLTRPHDRLTRPYADMPDLLDHQSAGRLQFTFAAQADHAPESALEIGGTYLDGRPFTATLVAAPRETPDLGTLFVDDAQGAEAPVAEGDQARLLQSGNHQPTLSPELLEGFPNPFRDLIQLRFQVPATIGEAFVWDKNEDPPAGLDLMATVPWHGGTPNVSVKIYSINGQELVTLYDGSQGPGENTVQWAGTDSYGRQVASGAYFCKLQLDDWSVTRRLVFLR